MANIKLTEFIHLFDSLSDAYYLIETENDSTVESVRKFLSYQDELPEALLHPNATEAVKNAYDHLTKINLNPDETGLLFDVLEEIYVNLNAYSEESKIKYIQDILKMFHQRLDSNFLPKAIGGDYESYIATSISDEYIVNCSKIYH
jgi:hypothetical protein